jgi:hypothetical protein|uniref:Uncharacterized protein n=1 Tax=Siphoviridae sp. ctO0R2 TaxID=2825476 RepID=A0A8S5PD38_9CAUD|nr:MAG TPA: hypothetical protein [Siphoviridae sp. ctO0R2]
MAKIDITKIEGYDKMTPEEKLAALEAFEYEDNSFELEKYKNAASKANSEAAEWRKKHNALLSEEEQKKQANEEELTTLRAKVEAMETRRRLSSSLRVLQLPQPKLRLLRVLPTTRRWVTAMLRLLPQRAITRRPAVGTPLRKKMKGGKQHGMD